MKRSNLIPITKIYDIYPKYTYSDGVKKFMDEIVDIDRANVYTKDEVIAMLTELQLDIERHEMASGVTNQGTWNECIACCSRIIQQKNNELKDSKDGNR